MKCAHLASVEIREKTRTDLLYTVNNFVCVYDCADESEVVGYELKCNNCGKVFNLIGQQKGLPEWVRYAMDSLKKRQVKTWTK